MKQQIKYYDYSSPLSISFDIGGLGKVYTINLESLDQVINELLNIDSNLKPILDTCKHYDDIKLYVSKYYLTDNIACDIWYNYTPIDPIWSIDFNIRRLFIQQKDKIKILATYKLDNTIELMGGTCQACKQNTALIPTAEYNNQNEQILICSSCCNEFHKEV